ncbi:hypothetical protein K438DRAFT_2017297 [Mycena galopus ATCC 62051]|nr:hypothetical protein K438DRAFT_2017297 [Mycena galopus ATCC 62051]
MHAHVVCMQLDAESLEGEWQLKSVVSTTSDASATTIFDDAACLSRSSRGLFYSGGAILLPAHDHLCVTPPPPWSTIEAGAPHTPDALLAHTGSQTRSTRRCPRLKPQEAIVACSRCPSAAQLPADPPCNISDRLSCASSIPVSLKRDTLRAMCCEAATSPLARYSAPDAVPHGHARYQASAHPSPDLHGEPHGQRVTLAFFIPHAAFVAFPVLCDPPNQFIALTVRRLRSHALQYYPQHLPPPQHAPRSFLVVIAAFIVFSYATTIHCPHRSTRAAWRIPNTAPMSPATAVAALHRAYRLHRLPARPGHPQHRPNPPLETCPWHTPPARRARHARGRPAAQREYDAHHPQRTQHTLQRFPITFVPSSRAATICGIHRPHRSTPLPARPRYSPQHHLPHRPRCASDHRADPFRRPTVRHPRLLYAARRQQQHPPAALHALCALTASSIFTVTRPRRVHGRMGTTRSLRCSSSYAISFNKSTKDEREKLEEKYPIGNYLNFPDICVYKDSFQAERDPHGDLVIGDGTRLNRRKYLTCL